jgi:hypothetical protein
LTKKLYRNRAYPVWTRNPATMRVAAMGSRYCRHTSPTNSTREMDPSGGNRSGLVGEDVPRLSRAIRIAIMNSTLKRVATSKSGTCRRRRAK